MQTVVFDSLPHLCDPWNTACNRKKTRTLLNYFVKGP